MASWRGMKFFGVTTASPSGLFEVCFRDIHIRLVADARPILTGGFLSMVRGAVPALAVAVAALFCVHSAMPAACTHRPGLGRAWEAPAVEGAHQTGSASWYGTPGDGFEYRKTACGETMDPDAWTCAHRSLPFGTIVLVENALNRRTAVLRVNDRGPYVGGRVIDLSRRGATEIGMLKHGVVPVRVWVVDGVLKGHATWAVRQSGVVSASSFPAPKQARRGASAPPAPLEAPGPASDSAGGHAPAPFPRLAEMRVRGDGEARPAPPKADDWPCRCPKGTGRHSGRSRHSRHVDPYINRES